MPFAVAVAPCGSGFTARGRRVLGFTPFFSGNCSHAITVYLDKTDVIRGCCFQAEGGCGSKHEIRGEAWPDQPADLRQFADDISAFPAMYREDLARSWVLSTAQLMDIINGTDTQPGPVPAVPEIPAENPDPEKPEIPAETAGNSDGGAGAVEGPGTPGTPEAIAIGPEPGPGTGERIDQPPKRRGFLEW